MVTPFKRFYHVSKKRCGNCHSWNSAYPGWGKCLVKKGSCSANDTCKAWERRDFRK